jgi:hypothetical protein
VTAADIALRTSLANRTAFGALQPWVGMASGIQRSALPGNVEFVDSSGSFSINSVVASLTVCGGVRAVLHMGRAQVLTRPRRRTG